MRLPFLKPASLLFVCSLFAVSACGGGNSNSSSNGGSGGSGGSGGKGGSGGTQIQCQEPSQLDVSGTWAAKVRMTVNLQGKSGATITLCPSNQTAEATLYMYLDMQQNASDPTTIDSITPHVCSVTLPVVSGLVGSCNLPADQDKLVSTQLQILPPLQQAFPTIQLAPVTGTLGGAAPGASLTAQKLLFVAGSTEQGANMPGWNTTDQACNVQAAGRTSQCDTNCVSDCTKLRDDDNDNYPGITLGVCGQTQADQQSNVPCHTDDPSIAGTTIEGRAWLDLQIDPTLTGTVKSSCEVTGHVDASILYNVVGGDVWLSSTPLNVTAAITSLPDFSVDPSKSVYRLLRIDGQHGAPDWKLGSDPVQACQAVLKNKNLL